MSMLWSSSSWNTRLSQKLGTRVDRLDAPQAGKLGRGKGTLGDVIGKAKASIFRDMRQVEGQVGDRNALR
jgi:hypothetical protein